MLGSLVGPIVCIGVLEQSAKRTPCWKTLVWRAGHKDGSKPVGYWRRSSKSQSINQFNKWQSVQVD